MPQQRRHAQCAYRLLCSGTLCAVIAVATMAVAIAAEHPVADDFVQQLGAESYSLRQRAEEQLRDLGVDALPALRNAANGSDLEVRYRARRLVRVIEHERQLRLLDGFLTDYDPELSQQLAGWSRFSEYVGEDRESRELFVDMYESEPDLMPLIGTTSALLPFLLEKRVNELQPKSGQRPVNLVVPASSTAVLLLASLDPAANPSATTRTVIQRVVGQSAFWRAASKSSSSPLRRLLAAWVRDATEIAAATRMNIGTKFQLPEAVEPALELIQSRVHGSQLQYAVFTVARLGTGEHIPVLEQLLDNAAVLSERQRGDDETFTCQVRDVALAALIHLIGKQPQDFGFNDLRPNSNSLFALNTAGFDSEEDREAAFRQWKLWVLTQRHNSRNVDENAVEGIGL